MGFETLPEGAFGLTDLIRDRDRPVRLETEVRVLRDGVLLLVDHGRDCTISRLEPCHARLLAAALVRAADEFDTNRGASAQ